MPFSLSVSAAFVAWSTFDYLPAGGSCEALSWLIRVMQANVAS
jgi:hypothetical protein